MTRLAISSPTTTIVVQDEQVGVIGTPSGRTTFPLGGWVTLTDDSFDLGSPQVVSTILESLVLDGSPVNGNRYDNATVTLNFLCVGGGATLAAARLAASEAEANLRRAVNQDAGFVLTVTPPGGIVVTGQVFRAQTTRQWAGGGFTLPDYDRVAAIEVTLTAPRLPFWQGPTETLYLASSGLFSRVVDNLDTSPSSSGSSSANGTTPTWNTVAPLTEGSGAQQAQGTATTTSGGTVTPLVIVATKAVSAVLVTQQTATLSLSVANPDGLGVLASSSLVLTSSARTYAPVTGAPPTTTLNGGIGLLTFDLRVLGQFGATESLTNYALTLTYQATRPASGTSTATVIVTIDKLRVQQAAGSADTGTYGGLYSLATTKGSDRALLTLAVAEPQLRPILSTVVAHTPRPGAINSDVPVVFLPSTGTSGSETVGAPWRGSYLPVLHMRFGSATGVRNLTLTISQRTLGGVVVGTQTYTRAYQPNLAADPMYGARTDGLVLMPDAQLPYRDVVTPPGGMLVYTVTVASDTSGDRPVALLMLSALGQTVITGLDNPGLLDAATVTFGVPALTATDPPVNGDGLEWDDALDVLTGPLFVQPATSQPVLVWSPDMNLDAGQPGPYVTATYQPSWSNEAYQ